MPNRRHAPQGVTRVQATPSSTPVIEIVTAEGAVTCPPTGHVARSVRFGLWDGAWTPDGQLVEPGTNFEAFRIPAGQSFIDRDSRRFWLRVTDPALPPRTRFVNATWGTEPARAPGTPSHQALEGGSSSQIELPALAGNPGVFAEALMLVNDPDDYRIAQEFDPGRTRLSSMFEVVTASYSRGNVSAPPVSVPVFAPEERRSLRLEIFMSDPPGQPAWTEDLRVARTIYARYGIWIWVDGPVPPHAPGTPSQEPPPAQLEPLHANILTRANDLFATLAFDHGPRPGRPGIRVFYLPRLPNRDRGQSMPPSLDFSTFVDSRGAALRDEAHGIVCIDANSRTRLTLAHELGHVLLDTAGENRGSTYDGLGHYFPNLPDAIHNLMHAGLPPDREVARYDAPWRLLPSQLRFLDQPNRYLVSG